MKKLITFCLISLFLILFATGQEFDTQPIKTEISSLESNILQAKAESEKYSGGLVKALLDSRIQILENTKAMLEQRLTAGNYKINIRYTVNGKEYVPPADKDRILQDIESNALTALKEMESAQKEADRYSGGLVKSLKLTTIATLQQQLATLEMKRCVVLFDIPLYALVSGGPSSPAPTPAKTIKEPPLSEIDGMFAAKLTGKHVFTANYSDHLGLNLVLTNQTEKDIKAVQGIAVFSDLFDTEILSVRLTIEANVPAGQSVKNDSYSLKLNKFDANQSRLRSIEMENLKMRYDVQSIIFKDGSTVKR